MAEIGGQPLPEVEHDGAEFTPEDLRGQLEPPQIRVAARGVWSQLLDGGDHVAISDMAALKPAMFGRTSSGTLFLRTVCVHCRREIRLPLEGEYPDPDDPKDGPAVVVERRMLSPVTVAIAGRMGCSACIERLTLEEERKDRAGRIEDRLRESGMPKGLAAEVSWETLLVKGKTPEETAKREAAIEAAREWSSKPRPERGLLFWGAPGSGKTRLAATAAVARMEHSPMRWVSVAVLMAQLAGGWNDDDRKAALKVLTSKAPAVLDDFDKVNPTENTRAQIFAALDVREQAGTPVIVTTNLNPSELKKKLGDVFVSRLIGMCQVLQYPGPDRRLELGS